MGPRVRFPKGGGRLISLPGGVGRLVRRARLSARLAGQAKVAHTEACGCLGVQVCSIRESMTGAWCAAYDWAASIEYLLGLREEPAPIWGLYTEISREEG